MGQTIAQKIISRVAGRETVEPGEFVMVSPDYTVGCEMYWPMHAQHMRDMGIDKFANADKVVMVIDHTTYTSTGSIYGELQSDMREFAKRTGMKNFFDVGRGGLRHMVMVERGFARPGLFIFSDEPNIASVGVFGTLNMPISWEVLVTMVTDENWIQVPDTARITVTGKMGHGVYVRDLVQAVNRDFAASDTLLPMCLEYAGPGISELSLDNRQALLACAYHAGANTAIMEVDEKAMAWVEQRADGRPFYHYKSDDDANFALEKTYDLSDLTPLVTAPPVQSNVVEVGEVTGIKINQATVGSCASNRLDDLRAAAKILKGRQVASGVTMYISPGSQEIYGQAAAEGLLTTFTEAGAVVMSPGCNTCWGYLGVLNDGEVSISTHQENYRGRNGSFNSDVYLGSPYVVAASAVKGEIADPREMLADSV
jgi:3-isopropylmalate/(R)-2-methylmalate dehydratase large subunit